jgi:hypothetical protein
MKNLTGHQSRGFEMTVFITAGREATRPADTDLQSLGRLSTPTAT